MKPIFALLLLALAMTACNPGHREPAAALAPASPTTQFAPVESGAAPPAAPATDPLALAAHAGLRYDCRQDSDCAIKDIGNCCGYYPACVHVESIADPEAVTRECAERGLAGICGYPVISACVCRAGRCEGVNEPIGDEAER